MAGLTFSDSKSIKLLNREMVRLFIKLQKISRFHFPSIRFLLETVFYQNKAVRKRKHWLTKGLHVPPFIIFSITQQCNLSCKGCYFKSQNRPSDAELFPEKAEGILDECKELGISIALIAGGEPFMRKDLLQIFGKYRDIVFPVFTNGTMLQHDEFQFLKKNRHIIPIISVEGQKSETDFRRGVGIFDSLMDTTALLKKEKLMYGISLTVTKYNFDIVTNSSFIETFGSRGCRFFFYIEYVPVECGSESLCITEIQRNKLAAMQMNFRKKFGVLFFAFPAGEEMFGGCLAAGRGFIHINPSGEIEPCPFAPFSDADLKKMTLKKGAKIKSFKHNPGKQ